MPMPNPNDLLGPDYDDALIAYLWAERDRYRKALAFYADEHAYTSTVPHDRGRTARSALAEDDDA